MTSADNALDGYVQVNDLMLQAQGTNCNDVAYEDIIAALNSTVVDEEGGFGMRQWIYQTCFEFGYFQTTGTHPNLAKSPKFFSFSANSLLIYNLIQ